MTYEKMFDLIKCSLYTIDQEGNFVPTKYHKPDAITYVMTDECEFVPKSEIAE